MGTRIVMSAGARTTRLLVCAVCIIEAGITSAENISESDRKIVDYLIPAESFANSTPAYLGVSADSVRTLDTLKDIGVALSNATQGGTGMVFQVAPVRLTNVVSSADYVGKDSDGKDRGAFATQWSRALVNTSLLYGQGRTELAGKNFDRQVVGAEVSFFFGEGSDPLLGLFNAHYACAIEQAEKEKEEKKRLGQLPSPTPVGSTPVVSPSDAVEGTRDPERAEAIRTCFEQKFQQPSWAQNRAYLSATTGWVKPTEAGQDKQRIGSSFGAGLSYAFGKPQSPGSERDPMLVLLSVNFKRGVDELALDKFAAGSVERKDSNLWSARLTGGYNRVRLLGEVSNASDKTITGGSRVFRQALGVDYRLTDGVWLTFRTGRMNKVTGDGQETVSSMSVSFTPAKN